MNAINVIGTYITSQKKHSNFKLALYFKIVCAKLSPPTIATVLTDSIHQASAPTETFFIWFFYFFRFPYQFRL